MDNMELYNNLFIESFKVNPDQLKNLEYNKVPSWDSVGHMVLIASLEEKFNIFFDTDDIIDFTSYEKGKIILRKYNIDV